MLVYNKSTMLYYGNDDDMKNFDQATKDVRLLKVKPTDTELLCLYGLYKQTIFGNNHDECPSLLNPKDRAKWNAWKSYSTMSRNRASREYTSLVEKLKVKYG